MTGFSSFFLIIGGLCPTGEESGEEKRGFFLGDIGPSNLSVVIPKVWKDISLIVVLHLPSNPPILACFLKKSSLNTPEELSHFMS